MYAHRDTLAVELLSTRNAFVGLPPTPPAASVLYWTLVLSPPLVFQGQPAGYAPKGPPYWFAAGSLPIGISGVYKVDPVPSKSAVHVACQLVLVM
jgi:hypothetical protein